MSDFATIYREGLPLVAFIAFIALSPIHGAFRVSGIVSHDLTVLLRSQRIEKKPSF
jgi:hypothetical protein